MDPSASIHTNETNSTLIQLNPTAFVFKKEQTASKSRFYGQAVFLGTSHEGRLGVGTLLRHMKGEMMEVQFVPLSKLHLAVSYEVCVGTYPQYQPADASEVFVALSSFLKTTQPGGKNSNEIRRELMGQTSGAVVKRTRTKRGLDEFECLFCCTEGKWTNKKRY